MARLYLQSLCCVCFVNRVSVLYVLLCVLIRYCVHGTPPAELTTAVAAVANRKDKEANKVRLLLFLLHGIPQASNSTLSHVKPKEHVSDFVLATLSTHTTLSFLPLGSIPYLSAVLNQIKSTGKPDIESDAFMMLRCETKFIAPFLEGALNDGVWCLLS